MAVASPARTTALHLLGAQRRRGARARDLMRGAREMETLGRKGRALATRLVLGVNVASGELDRRIDSFVSRPGSLEPRVRDALRLASFELLYLDTPRQVAVSQGVELVRGVQPRAARMANAVLRRVAECRPEVDEACEATDAVAAGARMSVSVDELVVASGYPEWLVEHLVAVVGMARAAGMCACALEPAPIYAAAGKVGVEGVEGLLGKAGLEPAATELPGCWRLGMPAGLSKSGLLGTCDVVAADMAAQMCCRVAAGAGRVLEVGQGRGTKSLFLASLASQLGGGAHIVGCELVASKARLSAARMESAGISDVVSCVEFDGTRLADEDDLPEALRGQFDSVLVDAPCSGTGTMRRHPETAWALEQAIVDPENVDSLPSLQLRLLRAAASRVAVGGSLVYATCSVLPEENSCVVERFLASEEGRGFVRGDILTAPAVAALDERSRAPFERNLNERGEFQSTPIHDAFDGHFFARLIRES